MTQPALDEQFDALWTLVTEWVEVLVA